MSDDTGNGGILRVERGAAISGGLDVLGRFTVDPVTGERRYGDGARLSADGAMCSTGSQPTTCCGTSRW